MIIILQENHHILGWTTTTITANFNDHVAQSITIKHIVMTSEHITPFQKLLHILNLEETDLDLSVHLPSHLAPRSPRLTIIINIECKTLLKY